MDMNISRRNLDDEFVPRKLQGTQILGSIAGAAVGHILGGGKSSKGNTSVQQTHANPFTSGGGLFNVSFGPGIVPGAGSAGVDIDAAVQEAVAAAMAQNVSQAPIRNPSPLFGKERFENSGGISSSGINRTLRKSRSSKKPFGLDMSIANPVLADINDLGLDAAGLFLNNAINNPLADQASGLAGDFMSQLTADPMEVALNQFNLLNPILQEQQMQEQRDLENRLFAQGRLGSTSGSQDYNAFLDSTRDAERKLLFDSLGQGMAVQAQNASLGAMLAQLDPTLRQANLGLGTGFLNIPLGLQQAMLSQAQVAGGLSGAVNTGTITSPGIDVGQSIGAGLLNQGIQGITNAIPGLFSGSGTSFDPSLTDSGFGGGSIFSTPGGPR